MLHMCVVGSENHPYVQAVTDLGDLWVKRALWVTNMLLHILEHNIIVLFTVK